MRDLTAGTRLFAQLLLGFMMGWVFAVSLCSVCHCQTTSPILVPMRSPIECWPHESVQDSNEDEPIGSYLLVCDVASVEFVLAMHVKYSLTDRTALA